jgi:hypothetical protein
MDCQFPDLGKTNKLVVHTEPGYLSWGTTGYDCSLNILLKQGKSIFLIQDCHVRLEILTVVITILCFWMWRRLTGKYLSTDYREQSPAVKATSCSGIQHNLSTLFDQEIHNRAHKRLVHIQSHVSPKPIGSYPSTYVPSEYHYLPDYTASHPWRH